MNKVLRGGIIGSLITLAAAIGGSEIYKHYTSPEYKQARVAEQRARELDEKLGFVFSNEPWNEGRTYKLSNGADIQIKLLYMDRTARLELIAGGTVLQSEPWWHNGDDNWFSHLRSLGSVRIIDSPDGVITTLGKGKIPNYAEWQKKYETLIEQTFAAKKEYQRTEEQKNRDALNRAEQALEKALAETTRVIPEH